MWALLSFGAWQVLRQQFETHEIKLGRHAWIKPEAAGLADTAQIMDCACTRVHQLPRVQMQHHACQHLV
jgi:hypothetical protein